jgi:hypothetical protein
MHKLETSLIVGKNSAWDHPVFRVMAAKISFFWLQDKNIFIDNQ